MEVVSAFKNEFFARLTTIFLPGAFATGPYVLVLNYYVPDVSVFLTKYSYAFVVVQLIVIVTAGRILEDIGSTIESFVWDKRLDKSDPCHLENWRKYLQLQMKDEIVGQRYLTNFVLRMKFELSMAPALVLFMIGLGWLDYLINFWSFTTFCIISGFILLLVIYLLWESYNSAVVCADTRKLILEAHQKYLKPSPIHHPAEPRSEERSANEN